MPETTHRKNERKSILKYLGEASALILAFQFIIACSFESTSKSQSTSAPSSRYIEPTIISGTETIDRQSGQTSASYRYVTSFRDLVTQSTVVAVGRVISTTEIINLARDVNDSSKPDSQNFVAGQVYQFQVDRFLKGNDNSVLNIVQPEAFIVGHLPTSQAEIEKAKATYKFIPFQTGTKYVLFLRPLNGFTGKEYFIGTAHPWRFSLTASGIAEPDSPWPDAIRFFPPRPTASMITEVVSLASGQPIGPATPQPTTSPTPLQKLYP